MFLTALKEERQSQNKRFDMDKIDVVIVDAGLSGLACAYKLAEKDMQVIVVERGDFPGSKNVTGRAGSVCQLRKWQEICLKVAF